MLAERSDLEHAGLFSIGPLKKFSDQRQAGHRTVVARTTVDLGLQKAADKAVEDTLTQFGRSRHFNAGALVSMETSGAVRAMVGGKDYGSSQFNRAAHAYRQPGSSFKPYVYLSAIQHLGYTPDRRVVDGYVSCGRWSPKNYSGGYRGAMTMRMALAKSINTVAVSFRWKWTAGPFFDLE